MRRGFTLIELLAVITILALLSAITVPIVTNTIEKANKSTTLESARELIKIASEDAVHHSYQLPYQYKIEEGKLQYQKGEFTRGLIVVATGNQSFVENLSTPKYCVNGPLNDLKITNGKCSSSTYKSYKGSKDIQKAFSIHNASDSVNGLYFDDFTREYYFRGNVTNNYVSFAGLTWRIISFQNGKVKLISQGTVSDVGSKNYTNSLTYLNATFYSNLKQKGYVVESEFPIGVVSSLGTAENIIASEQTAHTTYKVGLLTAGEYRRASIGSSNFITNGTTWLLTKQSNSKSYYLSSGTINNAAMTASYTVRPVLTLKETTVFSGSGTTTDPYIVK